ncbi:MAG: heat shock protein HtpX [Natronomonas sp.]|jgi:heat shock protein HtpX
MSNPFARTLMILIGVATLIVYTGIALLGFTAIEWIAANPPSPAVIVVTFAGITLVGAYLGYRQGVVRLAASLDARELPRQRAPTVYRRLDQLCEQMSVTQPPLLLADLDSPNALSVGGPRRGAIIVDRRLLDLLTVEELEGILAHELAHMEQYDTFINTVVLTLTRLLVGIVYVVLLPVLLLLIGVDRAAGWIAGDPTRRQVGLADLFQYGIGLVLTGLLSVFTLLFLARSRRQEYRADRRAAAVTGNPGALARALSKIQRVADPHRGLQSLLYTHDDQRRRRHRLLSTHPPLEERIGRLLDETDAATRQQPRGPAR